jgi:MFS transporter, YNFM family, putative membrane transport protein
VPARTAPSSALAMSGLLAGAAGMFATMYSTQAILPDIGRDFEVSPPEAGLTISIVVVAVAVAGWVWGPVSDRHGRKRSLTLASGLLAIPTLGAALAPSFPALLAFRGLQGLCMPGLLIVGVPYVAEVFTPSLGGRAMGYYVASLVAGGLVGRVGVGLLTAAAGWRWALGLLVALPLAAAAVMLRTLPEAPRPARSPHRSRAVAAQLRNPRVLRPAIAASALFFTFVSVFSYSTFRLERKPFGYGTGEVSLLFALWAFGAAGPPAGRLADRVGWRKVTAVGVTLAIVGVLLSLPATLVTLVPGLSLVILGMFAGATAAQLGVAEAGEVDRGVASAVYFSFYYVAGALAGFVPGLAWQEFAWPGVAVLAVAVLALGLTGLALPLPSRWTTVAPDSRGGLMHARTGTFEVPPERIDGMVRQLQEEQIPRYREQQGYKGFTVLADRERGKVVGISFWEGEPDLEASEELGRRARLQAAETGQAAAEPVREKYEVVLDDMV